MWPNQRIDTPDHFIAFVLLLQAEFLGEGPGKKATHRALPTRNFPQLSQPWRGRTF
jgi:hypothetical protein